ncbi:MAG: 4-alpha-glucanotransferase [Capsulimonadaceae bacterium]
MKFPRTSGILLHPTSFPGPYGIGDLGEAAYAWVDFLAKTGQTLWQLMPLGYTGYGDSPYQSFSAFAGDPLLISPDALGAEGWLTSADLAAVPKFDSKHVDYGPVIEWKMALLRRAGDRFYAQGGDKAAGFQDFVTANAGWLDDFSLFMATKEGHGGAAWVTWEPDIRSRQPAALIHWAEKVAPGIAFNKFMQYAFFAQWGKLKGYANGKGIKIIGDIPIFVAYDSDDVWANPELFDLAADGKALSGAGVPPDYFSATGQLWGNPLYRWEEIARQDYAWWIRRFRGALSMYDILRIDHFRGFEAYWSVPAGEETAVNGKWIKGPGRELFVAVHDALGELPIIAEDLGMMTADVLALRDAFGFPGMKILEFAFSDDPLQEYLPHNYAPNCVVYSGTHDNDTVVGWYEKATDREKHYYHQYTGGTGKDVAWDFLRLAFSSVADMAVVPLQDVLGLGSEARMNTPGTAAGNWGWRYRQDQLTSALAERLHAATYAYGRGYVRAEPKKAAHPPHRHAQSPHPHVPHPHLAAR